MTINERIKHLRTELLKDENGKKMTLDAFSARLAVKAPAIYKIESGENAVTERMIAAICAEYDVREEWLRYGEGEPFRQLSPDEQLAEWMGEVMSEDESDIQRRVVKFLSKLTPAEWEMIADMAHKFVEELKKGEE